MKAPTPKRWLIWTLAALGGGLQTLSLAPFDQWWCLPLALAAWLFALQRDPIVGSFAYGVGLFGSGASWIWVSMVTISATPIAIALVLELAFLGLLASTLALCGWGYARLRAPNPWLCFPALVVAAEVIRTFAFTGFPWLFAGYGLIDSPWGWLASVVGVYGLSALAAVVAVAVHQPSKLVVLLPILGLLAWLKPPPLGADAQPISVRLIQPNVPAEKKWDPDWRTTILNRHIEPTLTADTDWVIWSENAVPLYGADADAFFNEMARQRPDIALFAGRLIEAPPNRTRRFYNAIEGFADAGGRHYKSRLVPFGEYVPLEGALRGLIDFFDLPLSTIVPGHSSDPLRAGPTAVSALICYEVAYPLLAWTASEQADVLLTVSNDAWFGHSIARDQHLQMARMRALELGRPMLRATNDGISAVIDAQGRISARLDSGVTGYLDTTLNRTGIDSLYRLWGPWPVWILSLGLLLSQWRGLALPSRRADR
ncbi:apolipoprotein N-acyltransferase [Litorivicinus lipolyticus]|uniref:apolipoprotein N-acyltransferase n=1 Tax=Litorivicinus lipolyticus TaxID=418701 RepID=UPI0014795D09|nr:apolipoprotein N-acyltransferase [Litorivicinus lipolyticus]